MHLTLGLGFFFGGMNRVQQHFNVTVSHTYATMLLLAMSALIILTVIRLLQVTIDPDDVLRLSRAISIILLLSYGAYLFFSLRTHIEVYMEPSMKTPKKHVHPGKGSSAAAEERYSYPEDDDDETPMLSLWTAVISLLVFTAILGFNTASATDSLDGLIQYTGLTDTFIGVVLLPLLGLDFTILQLPIKDKMDPFIALTVGKCLQIALLVIPITVTVGWIANIDMSLDLMPLRSSHYLQ